MTGELVQARGRGFSLYLCPGCYDNLVQIVAASLAHIPSYKGQDPLGIYCVRCEGRKLGNFVRVQTVEYRRKGKLLNFGKPKILYQVYCEECWREIWTAPSLILKTKRSFYVPDEEAGLFSALFKGGVERTSQVYTLVKTEDLRALVRHLPKRAVKELGEMLLNE